MKMRIGVKKKSDKNFEKSRERNGKTCVVLKQRSAIYSPWAKCSPPSKIIQPTPSKNFANYIANHLFESSLPAIFGVLFFYT